MKTESIEKLKQLMVKTYRKFGDETALLIKDKRSYTGNEIAEEIENETEFGIKMVDNMIQLTIDLLKRDKINMSDGNKLFQATIECSNSCYVETLLITAKDKTEAHKLLCKHEKREVRYKSELKELALNMEKATVIPMVGFGENDNDNNYDD